MLFTKANLQGSWAFSLVLDTFWMVFHFVINLPHGCIHEEVCMMCHWQSDRENICSLRRSVPPFDPADVPHINSRLNIRALKDSKPPDALDGSLVLEREYLTPNEPVSCQCKSLIDKFIVCMHRETTDIFAENKLRLCN